MINNNKKEKKMTNKTVTFCITGALDKMRRVDAIQLVQNETNARWISGVSSRTDYLGSKRADTRKASNAKKFGTKVINEAQMMTFVKAGKFPSRNLN